MSRLWYGGPNTPTKEIERICSKISRLCKSNSDYFKDAVCLAIENVYVRAHRFEARSYSVKAFRGKRGVIVRIRDSGEGFDYENTKKMMINHEKYFQGLGAGFMTFHYLKDEVSFENGGTTINLVYKFRKRK